MPWVPACATTALLKTGEHGKLVPSHSLIRRTLSHHRKMWHSSFYFLFEKSAAKIGMACYKTKRCVVQLQSWPTPKQAGHDVQECLGNGYHQTIPPTVLYVLVYGRGAENKCSNYLSYCCWTLLGLDRHFHNEIEMCSGRV